MINRFVAIGQAGVDAAEDLGLDMVGRVRLWRNMGADIPPVASEVYIIYADMPLGFQIPASFKAVGIFAADVDRQVSREFARAGLNLVDYGPGVRRAFILDVPVGAGVITALMS